MHRRYCPRQDHQPVPPGTSCCLPLPGPPEFLHAISSGQVSVNEVPGAQVLHATGNVHHEPDQGLQGQVLVGRQGKLRLDLPTQLGQGEWGSLARKPKECPQNH
jgi:hypothetical protein